MAGARDAGQTWPFVKTEQKIQRKRSCSTDDSNVHRSCALVSVAVQFDQIRRHH